MFALLISMPNGRVLFRRSIFIIEWINKIQQLLVQELQTHSKLIVLGDFNIAPEDRDVCDPQAWSGQVLCSDKEAGCLQSALPAGFSGLF